jgi:hypothetical protein
MRSHRMSGHSRSEPPLPVPCSLIPVPCIPSRTPPAQSPHQNHPRSIPPPHLVPRTSYLEPLQPCQPPRPDPKSSTPTNKTSSTPKIAKNTWHSSFTHTHIIEAGGELPAAPASAQRRKQPAKHMILWILQNNSNAIKPLTNYRPSHDLNRSSRDLTRSSRDLTSVLWRL